MQFPGSSLAEEALSIRTPHGDAKFRVEIARTPQEQERGLMYRTELAPDRGMLFLFPHPREITMWMKNTYLPLDMLFIHADGTVTRIAENTVPESEALISSGGAASAVLELPAGTARRLRLAPGDTLLHEAFTHAQ